MSPPNPSPRTVLLAVTGLTPQVITETVYALARTEPEQIPSEIRVVTTTEGAERVRLALLSERPGWFRRLIADYKLPAIDFDESRLHVLKGLGGAPLPDIRSAQDNEAAADQVADIVRQLTCDPGTRLHVSLAGGRKTMGFFAGYALGLWGRPQDRLSHVLVDEPFESCWDFFYPTPYEHVIETRDKRLIDAAQGGVTLADIPFVRLRHGLPERLLAGQARFSDAVAAAQIALGPPRLQINVETGEIVAGGCPVPMEPADAAFLFWFAERARAGLPGLPRPHAVEPEQDYARAYLTAYDRLKGRTERGDERYRLGMSQSDFDERKSRVVKAMRNALGVAAPLYCFVADGRPKRFRLALPPEAITVLGA